MVSDLRHQNNDFHFDFIINFPGDIKVNRWIMMIFPNVKICESKQQSDGKSRRGKSISIRLYSDYEIFPRQSLHAQLRLIPTFLRLLHIWMFPLRRWKAFYTSIKQTIRLTPFPQNLNMREILVKVDECENIKSFFKSPERFCWNRFVKIITITTRLFRVFTWG